MSVCIKCGGYANHPDAKTICDECVIQILQGLPVEDIIEIQKEALTRIRVNEARWKAKGAGYR